MAKKVMGTHNFPNVEIQDGKLVRVVRPRRVEIMAEAKGYAMVRIPRCAPYAAPLEQIVKDHP